MIKLLKNNNIYILVLLTALFIIFNILSYLSDGSYIGGDSYVRYQFARYSFQYPEFFLDHWAKPIFIALAAPFAQLGYLGIKLFNITIGLLIAYFAYLICKSLNFKNTWLIILFVCFSPIFYMMMFTGMTEVFFGFIIMLTLFLIVREKYIFSAIVLSFLPIVRNEGIAIWILFIFLYIIRKKYKAIPFLLLGFLLYSFIGWFYFGDFWWLITHNPYKPEGTAIYGHGEWYFYLVNIKATLGIPLTILFIIGLLSILIELLKTKLRSYIKNEENQIVVLTLFVFLTYFAIHSILWWKGWMSVLGDVRFMAAVTPFAAIIGLKGLDFAMSIFNKIKIVSKIIAILLAVLTIYTAQLIYSMPVHLSGPNLLVKRTADWLKDNKLDNNKIYFYDPLFPMVLNKNPFDQNQIKCLIPNSEKPEENINKNEIVLWDAHFSANEGHLPLERMKNNPNFTILNVFRPATPFIVLGGYNYEIYVFQKIN